MAGNRNIRLVGLGREPDECWRKEVVEELKSAYGDWVSNKSTERELGRYRVIDGVGS
jgi:hypothetical protein